LTTVYNLMVTEIMDGSSCASCLEGDGFKSEPRDQQARLLSLQADAKMAPQKWSWLFRNIACLSPCSKRLERSYHNMQQKYVNSTERKSTSQSDRIHLFKWTLTTCFGEASSPYVNRLNEYIAFETEREKKPLLHFRLPIVNFFFLLLFWALYM
jgi:hypothetical protein